ncbi:MAG TPA: heme o synthase [Terracidiphilus sp.]|jgi:protoheme IX farnesyltransferase|nr:heme o synthase [Terracidiphilus sp.]
MIVTGASFRPKPSVAMIPASQASPVVLPARVASIHEAAGESAIHVPKPGTTATLINDLRELFKVRVTGMVVVTGWAGFYLGSMHSGISTLQRGLIDTLIGIGLVSAGAGALNQALERSSDARMIRTADRPLPSGRVSLTQGVLAGIAALALGSWWLLLHTNLLTVSLALLTAFTYVAVYTPLKRVTTLATFIGAFPGAMGPLLGWTAARGQIEWPAVALFAILFVWQFPHFMAIAWLYREDYARAGIRMLPVVQPDGMSTFVEALFYAILMIPVSLTPWWLGLAGPVYAAIALLLGLFYLGYTIRFRRILRDIPQSESRMIARDLLKVSVIYLPALLTALMVCAIAKR